MPDDQPPEIQHAIGGVELQEFLFSQTAVRYAERILQIKQLADEEERSKIADHIRGAFRLNRFAVMSWLMMNGVKIPAELLDDRTHPEVGEQRPDQPV